MMPLLPVFATVIGTGAIYFTVYCRTESYFLLRNWNNVPALKYLDFIPNLQAESELMNVSLCEQGQYKLEFSEINQTLWTALAAEIQSY